MDKKIINIDMVSGKFELNMSSVIVDVYYNADNGNYEVEYYESPFSDGKDIYQAKDLALAHLEQLENVDFLKGYFFYGTYSSMMNGNKFGLFVKQVGRVSRSK